MAETEAWAVMKGAGKTTSLAVINPDGILGPLLDDDPGATGELVIRMMRGAMPVAPGVVMGWVDVRDVAAAHVAALDDPTAGGGRHIVSGSNLSLLDVADALRAAFPACAARLPKRQLPNWLVRTLAIVDPSLRSAKTELGPRPLLDGARGIALIGRPLRNGRDAAVATAASALARGLV